MSTSPATRKRSHEQQSYDGDYGGYDGGDMGDEDYAVPTKKEKVDQETQWEELDVFGDTVSTPLLSLLLQYISTTLGITLGRVQ